MKKSLTTKKMPVVTRRKSSLARKARTYLSKAKKVRRLDKPFRILQREILFHKRFYLGRFRSPIEFRSRWDARMQSYVFEVWIGETKIMSQTYELSKHDQELVAFTQSVPTKVGDFRGKVVIGLAVSRGEVYYRLEGRLYTRIGTVHTVYIPGPTHRQVTVIHRF
ncbi:hypothetical protein [Ammoniphilus sp. 3BR4]|uniref:hypothetical protein n=1 Tax=Ammoniphilus sp. 3BR4 TaxID=3158265 RepID=UPI0034666DEE